MCTLVKQGEVMVWCIPDIVIRHSNQITLIFPDKEDNDFDQFKNFGTTIKTITLMLYRTTVLDTKQKYVMILNNELGKELLRIYFPISLSLEAHKFYDQLVKIIN